MTQKERELLLLLARETTWRRPEYQACLNLAREIEAEVQPAPDPQAPPAAKSLDEALAGLPVIGALHSVGGPGSGVFAAGPPRKKADSPAEPTPEDKEKAREVRKAWEERCLSSNGVAYTLTQPDWMDEAIASALAAERQRTAQRCAEIAREVAKSYGSESGMQDRRGVGADVVMRLIHREFGLEPGNAKGATE